MNYVGILIEREDGKLLFQLRDNKPNIRNPNKWGIFGGGIEKNETPIQAAIRELNEELGIKIKKNQLKLFMTFYWLKKRNYLFNLKLSKNIKKLKLKEGSEMRFFHISEMIKKEKVVISLRLFLLLYPILYLIKNKFYLLKSEKR